jgi:histidinol-phosphate aminotransferase
MLHGTSVIEKGGGTFAGIKLLLCENPLPPIVAAVEAAARELLKSNFYTEQYSHPLREAIGRCWSGTPTRCSW